MTRAPLPLTPAQRKALADIVQRALLQKTDNDVHLARTEIVHAVIDDLHAAGWLLPPRRSLLARLRVWR